MAFNYYIASSCSSVANYNIKIETNLIEGKIYDLVIPGAKFAHQFNKAHIFADKNKYHRNARHRNQEVSLITLTKVIRETSCILAIAS